MTKKGKAKKPKGKSKNQGSTELAVEEKVALDVWTLMDTNPLYVEMDKPTIEYIQFALKNLPEIKTMDKIEIREHCANMVILGWLRDGLFNHISKVGIGNAKAKDIRLVYNIIERQEEVLPRIFNEISRSFGEKVAGKKIRETLIERTIQFDIVPEDNEKGGTEITLKKGEYKVSGDETDVSTE